MRGGVEKTLLAACLLLLASARTAAEGPGPARPPAVEQVEKLLAAGRFAEAEDAARTLVNATSSAPESIDAAEALDLLVTALSHSGKAAAPETAELARKAVTLKERIRGAESRAAAISRTNLGVILKEAGAYGEAHGCFDRALAVLDRGKVEDATLLACLNNFAGLLQAEGDAAAALSLFKRVLAAREKALGPEDVAVARALNQLAMALMDSGRPGEALPLETRALAIWEKTLPPGHPSVASGMNNLGWIHRAMGDTVAARSLFEKALASREKALPEDHPFLAFTRENLAKVLEASSDPSDLDRALALHRRALEARQKSLGPEHPLVARSLRSLALALRKKGETDAAFELALGAEEISRGHLRLVAQAMAEKQALRYRRARDLESMRTSGIELALALVPSVKEPTAPWRAWESLARSRAIVLGEAGARRKAAEASDPEIARLSDDLRVASERLANVLVQSLRTDASPSFARTLDATRARVEEAERALAAKSSAFREARAVEDEGLARAVGAIGPAAALVAFARSSTSEGTSVAYSALVLRSGERTPALVSIGDAEQIDALVARWREEVSPGRAARDPRRAEDSCREAGRALRRRIWDPVAAAMGDARRVFLVPEGSIHCVNFAALPGDGGEYVVESAPGILYLTAESRLAAPAAVKSGSGLLAIGGPDFGEAPAADAPPGLELLRFAPLAATADEAKEIGELWSRAAGQEATVKVLTGAAATETAFKKLAPGCQALHVATHGFFLDGSSMALVPGVRGIARLKKRNEAQPGGAPAARSDASEIQSSLSGLAFAGANLPPGQEPSGDDGILTAEEISVMDLSTVELAVLSACDTGIGRIEPGEGVLGLRRAFQSAGARTLILSLWPVEDRSGREWMRAFYASWRAGEKDASASARDAMLASLRARRERNESTHPFFWGAFVPTGR